MEYHANGYVRNVKKDSVCLKRSFMNGEPLKGLLRKWRF